METIETGTDQVLCTLEEGVATLTLNRPEARNALSDTLTPALRKMIKQLGEDDQVGALIITGAGKAFCAGGDVKGMAQGPKKERTLEEAAEDLKVRQRTLTGALMALRIPTIAALPGPAAGAGLALALACDMRIAARSAFVTAGYARVALSGDYGINWLLTRLVGTAKARELMFTADKIDAPTCERLGLVNQVVEDEVLQESAATLARRLAAGPRQALASMKDNLDQALTSDFLTALDHEADLLVRLARTEDHREATRAFVEKRPPRFGSHNKS